MRRLKRGQIYRVTHQDMIFQFKVTTARRVFKGTEKRFGAIRCYVFSTRINRNVSISCDKAGTITMAGKRLPMQEISIPGYCIKEVKDV